MPSVLEPTSCCSAQTEEPHEYVQILEQQRYENQRDTSTLKHTYADVQPYSLENPQGERGAEQCASPGDGLQPNVVS